MTTLNRHISHHFWVQVFFSSKDPSKLKLYSSKEEVLNNYHEMLKISHEIEDYFPPIKKYLIGVKISTTVQE